MRSARLRAMTAGPAGAAALLGLALVVAGAAIWFVPYLTRQRQQIAETAAPPPLFVLGEFPVQPHQSACLESVTLTAKGDLAQFGLRPATTTPRGGPPVEVVLSAPGYGARAHVPGGYPGGGVALPIAPPPRDELGTVCFINRGDSALLLAGSKEARTISRSQLLIAGEPVAGDVALAFLRSRPRSLLEGLGEVFGHASNLTDRLIPVWLIWILAVLVAFGVPVATLAALYAALRDDEAAHAT